MKSPAYGKVRALITSGFIQDFQQIAEEIQKIVLAKDLRMHFNTLQARIVDPGKWEIHQLAILSDLLEIDHKILLEMADKLRVQKKKGKK